MVLLTPVLGKGRACSGWSLGLLAPGGLVVRLGRAWGPLSSEPEPRLWAHPLWPITCAGERPWWDTAEQGAWLCRHVQTRAFRDTWSAHGCSPISAWCRMPLGLCSQITRALPRNRRVCGSARLGVCEGEEASKEGGGHVRSCG